MTGRASDKAALRGEPSYVWRAGQERRLEMVRQAAGERMHGRVFEGGCGIGSYLFRLQKEARQAVGLDIELERAARPTWALTRWCAGPGRACLSRMGRLTWCSATR